MGKDIGTVLIRYCTRCQKEFDVAIKSMDELEDLHCPYCQAKVDKNSRPPVSQKENEEMGNWIGRMYYLLLRFRFVIYPICGAVGCVAYVLKWNTILYAMTLFTMCIFLLTRMMTSFAVLWPIGGAIIGYVTIRTPEGAYLGIMVAWLLRHIWRLLWINVIVKLIQIGR